MRSLPLDAVSGLLMEAAEELVLPRFRALRSGDVTEKAPGDLVTIVDREVEAWLTSRLRDLLAGSTVVGEEGVATDPSRIGRLGSDWVWVIDPLDGTINFVEGRESFAMMVGLLRDGAPVASWILSPLNGDLIVAESGGGATLNDRPFFVADAVDPSVRPMASTGYFPSDLARRWNDSSLVGEFDGGSGSAGVEYPALVAGERAALFYWRTLPWDHMPGALLVEEAGGHVARPDGSVYRVTDEASGILVAPNEDEWMRVRGLLSEVLE